MNPPFLKFSEAYLFINESCYGQWRLEQRGIWIKAFLQYWDNRVLRITSCIKSDDFDFSCCVYCHFSVFINNFRHLSTEIQLTLSHRLNDFNTFSYSDSHSDERISFRELICKPSESRIDRPCGFNPSACVISMM